MNKEDYSQIREICNDMASGNWEKHWKDNKYILRPSGNPLTKEQNTAMRNSKDIIIEKEDMVSINSIEVYGDIAVSCFTVHQIFSYKGNKENDVSVVLSVFKKENNDWKMIHGSRSQGRKPGGEMPKFLNIDQNKDGQYNWFGVENESQ